MRGLFALLLVACAQPPAPIAPTPPPFVPPAAIAPPVTVLSPHLPFGEPKGPRVVVLDRKYFVVGFDPELHLARWVAWKLERADLGSISRASSFHSDPSQGYVQDSDYVKTGYDRGHLCPSADRTATEEGNRATFVLSNVHPQLHELNAGPWEDLEKKERELARAGHVVYIVAGGIFDAEKPSIMKRGIPVPSASFKVVVVVDPGEPVHSGLSTMGAIMPNELGVKKHAYTDFVMPIRAVEKASGYDFEPDLPRPVQDAIENQGWVEPPSAKHVSSRD